MSPDYASQLQGQKTALGIFNLEEQLWPSRLHWTSLGSFWPLCHQRDFSQAERGRISPRGHPTAVPKALALSLLGTHPFSAGRMSVPTALLPTARSPDITKQIPGLSTAGNLCWRLSSQALKNKQKMGEQKALKFLR